MKSHNILRREAGHGGKIPRGWQMAWYEPRRRVGVYYPAPLHLFFRVMREIAYRIGVAWRAPSIEIAQVFDMQRVHRDRQNRADEYARGYLCGWRECFHACMNAVEEELSLSEDVWAVGDMLADGAKPPRKN